MSGGPVDQPADEIERLPKPPRLPRPMPEPPQAGWWLSPGYDPRVLRYHDGSDWTDFECRLGLRGPGPVMKNTTPAPGTPVEPDDPEVRRLPPVPAEVRNLPDYYQPASGWFWDLDTRKNVLARYREDFKWTEFVCPIGNDGPGAIYRRAIPDWY